MQSDQCITCEHYRGQWTCAAFPKKIPAEIASGEHDHREPFKGDGGIRWEKWRPPAKKSATSAAPPPP